MPTEHESTGTDRSTPPRTSPFASLLRHPVISAVMLTCTLTGAVLGLVYLDADWSLLRRLAAGSVAGAGTGFLITATKLLG